jgi:dihydrodipicolinate synthase/N-acetylneuraminate lyase
MPITATQLIEDAIGCYPPATVACFDPTRGELPRRQLDPERTVAFLERLAGAGAQGVLIASSTGQGHLRTPEEMAEWLRCAGGARLGATVRMGLLRPEDGPVTSLRLMDLLVEHEYPVVFLRPGSDLPADAGADQVSRQLAPLVQAAADRGLAVGLYSIPDVSGLPLTPETTARLVNAEGGDHIVAVKITEADYEASTARFLAHAELQHLKIVQGWDPHLGRALREGPLYDSQGRQRTGITSGLMSLALYQYQHLLEAGARGDWDELEQAQAAATALFTAMQDDPQHFADLQRAKYIMGLGHPLTGTVEPAQVERVFAALERLPRAADRRRLARSLDLMGDGPCHVRLEELAR